MDITYLPLRLIYYAGQNIFGNKLIFTILDTMVISSCISLGLLEPMLHFVGPETWAGALEIAGPSHQWLTKMLIYKLYKQTFRKLLNDMNNFWPLDYFDKEQEANLIHIYKKVTLGFKIFFWCSAVASTLMVLKPIPTIFSTRKLPIMAYHVIDFTQSPFYEFMYLWHSAYCYLITTFIVGFDGLFFVLCTSVAVQLILLKRALREMKINDDEDRRKSWHYVKIYVQHYNFVMEFLKTIKSVFSVLLLNQFLSSTICVCMAIYLIYDQGVSDIVFVLRCGLYSLAGVIQIFIYCLTGSQVQTQVETISDAIYECDWWKENTPHLKYAALMTMQRSQNNNIFKAGGMINLDLPCFVAILRMSFSFFTLMQSKDNRIATDA